MCKYYGKEGNDSYKAFIFLADKTTDERIQYLEEKIEAVIKENKELKENYISKDKVISKLEKYNVKLNDNGIYGYNIDIQDILESEDKQDDNK